MHEQFVAIFPNDRQNFDMDGKQSKLALASYEGLLRDLPSTLRLGLVNTCSEAIGDIGNSIVAVVIRVNTLPETNSVDWNDLERKILRAKIDFRGKEIFVDCGMHIDDILIRKSNGNNITYHNDGFIIKAGILQIIKNSLPKQIEVIV